jgi:hypothetical protein
VRAHHLLAGWTLNQAELLQGVVSSTAVSPPFRYLSLWQRSHVSRAPFLSTKYTLIARGNYTGWNVSVKQSGGAVAGRLPVLVRQGRPKRSSSGCSRALGLAVGESTLQIVVLGIIDQCGDWECGHARGGVRFQQRLQC